MEMRGSRTFSGCDDLAAALFDLEFLACDITITAVTDGGAGGWVSQHPVSVPGSSSRSCREARRGGEVTEVGAGDGSRARAGTEQVTFTLSGWPLFYSDAVTFMCVSARSFYEWGRPLWCVRITLLGRAWPLCLRWRASLHWSERRPG